jgi:hypothetical protein
MAEPRRFKLSRLLIVGGGLLIAANLLLFAGLSHDDDSRVQLPAEIQQLYPNPQEVIRPQETVGADLRDDLQGQLAIDGAVVPADQIAGDPNLGIVTFRPGCAGSGTTIPGFECAYRELEPGTHNLRIEFWPRTETFEEASGKGRVGSYGWQIKVG